MWDSEVDKSYSCVADGLVMCLYLWNGEEAMHAFVLWRLRVLSGMAMYCCGVIFVKIHKTCVVAIVNCTLVYIGSGYAEIVFLTGRSMVLVCVLCYNGDEVCECNLLCYRGDVLLCSYECL